MEVICIVDNPDGSATVELDVTKEDLLMLAEVGFNEILRQGLNSDVSFNNRAENSEQEKGINTK